MTKWGPWIRHDGVVRPSGFRDDQVIEGAFIGNDGEMKVRSARVSEWHYWEDTLAYRVEQVETTQVLYGMLGGTFSFTGQSKARGYYKITYTVNQDGDVLSCKMEKL